MDDSGAVTPLTTHQGRVLRSATAELSADGRICRLADRLEARAGDDAPSGEREAESVVLVLLLGFVVTCAGAVALLTCAVSAHHLDLIVPGAALLIAAGASVVRLAGPARDGDRPDPPRAALRLVR